MGNRFGRNNCLQTIIYEHTNIDTQYFLGVKYFLKAERFETEAALFCKTANFGKGLAEDPVRNGN